MRRKSGIALEGMRRVWADLNRFVSRDARGYTIPTRNARWKVPEASISHLQA